MVFSNFTAITKSAQTLLISISPLLDDFLLALDLSISWLDLMLSSRLILASETAPLPKRTPAHLDRIGVAAAQMFSSTHSLLSASHHVCSHISIALTNLRGCLSKVLRSQGAIFGMTWTAFLLPYARRLLVTGIEWMKGLRICLFVLLNAFRCGKSDYRQYTIVKLRLLCLYK